MAVQVRELRENRDFLKLWTGETVSQLGSQVTLLALPLTAVVLLDASPFQMGVLRAAGTLPFLMIGLLAGVWVDRWRRRPILIGTDLGRAALLMAIPLAAVVGMLRIELLYLVAFAVGLLTVFFDVAYLAFLPILARREHLVEDNAKLEMSRSIAQIAGPGLAGGLVQLVGGAVAILVDAASYLASAACLWTIRTKELPPVADSEDGIWTALVEGLGAIVKSPVLRSIAACTSLMNLFGSAAQAVFVLYLVRDLGITPALAGLVMVALGPGALLGALLTRRITERLGVGRTICAGPIGSLLPAMLIATVAGPPSVVVPVLAVSLFLQGLLSALYNVTQVSLRQTLVPDRLQGRMNATMRFIVWGTVPIGSLAGGALGEAVGLRPVLAVGVIGVVLASLVITRSPVRHLRDEGDAPSQPPATGANSSTESPG